MQSSRLHYLDYSRGLAIISVLCVHIFGQIDNQTYQQNNIVITILKSMSYLPMFFIIAGSLCVKTLNNKHNTTQYCLSKYLKNSLYPFCSFSIIFLIMHIIGSHYSIYFKSPVIIVSTLMKLAISNTQNLSSGVLWYLFTLFLCYMTVLLWVRIFNIPFVILLLLSFIIKIIAPLFDNIYLLSIDRYTEYLCFFVFGFYFSNYLLKLKIDTSLWYASFCLVAYIITISLSLYYGERGRIFSIVACFLGPLSILLIFRRLEIFCSNPILRILEFIGINSLLIYLLHMPSIKILTLMIYNIGLNNFYASFGLLLIIGIICPLIIGQLLSFCPYVYEAIFFRKPLKHSFKGTRF